MAITLGNAASSNANVSQSVHTYTFDSGAAATDKMLVVHPWGVNGNIAISSITYAGVTMTAHATYASGEYGNGVYYLPAPADGSNNLVITFASATPAGFSAVVIAGAKQTSPVNAYATDGHKSDNTDRGQSITTTVAGCAVFTLGAQDNGNFAADSTSTLVTSGSLAGTPLFGIVRMPTFPQASAGAIVPFYDGQAGSWGRAHTIAFEPSTGGGGGTPAANTRSFFALV